MMRYACAMPTKTEVNEARRLIRNDAETVWPYGEARVKDVDAMLDWLLTDYDRRKALRTVLEDRDA